MINERPNILGLACRLGESHPLQPDSLMHMRRGPTSPNSGPLRSCDTSPFVRVIRFMNLVQIRRNLGGCSHSFPVRGMHSIYGRVAGD